MSQINCEQAPTQDWERRHAAIQEPLMRLIDGKPGLVVSDKDCPVFRRGLMGGYQYPVRETSLGRLVGDRPVKNHFSHIVEGGQYGLSAEGEGMIEAPDETDYDEHFGEKPRGGISWMS